MQIFQAFYEALYHLLKFYQHLVKPFLGSQSYWFSIVMLTISVRVVLIPLTVKQVRSTRAMTAIAPELKQLQTKYKNDKPKQQEEMMRLYRERGVNPLAGCWPIAFQAPFFFALYRVIYNPRIGNEANVLVGKKFFNVPLNTRWGQLPGISHKIFSAPGITILLFIIAMASTTFISQRQLMSKQTMQVNPQQAMLMKYLPLMFGFFAINFPFAVIIYWVTTNLWSMGQQYIILSHQPPMGGPVAAGEVADAPAPHGARSANRPSKAGRAGGTTAKAGGATAKAGGRSGTAAKGGGRQGLLSILGFGGSAANLTSKDVVSTTRPKKKPQAGGANEQRTSKNGTPAKGDAASADPGVAVSSEGGSVVPRKKGSPASGNGSAGNGHTGQPGTDSNGQAKAPAKKASGGSGSRSAGARPGTSKSGRPSKGAGRGPQRRGKR